MLRRTIYNNNLRTPDSITVECGSHIKTFPASDKRAVGEWVREIWNNEFFPEPAYLYFNIDWDCDHILYCKYELV